MGYIPSFTACNSNSLIILTVGHVDSRKSQRDERKRLTVRERRRADTLKNINNKVQFNFNLIYDLNRIYK